MRPEILRQSYLQVTGIDDLGEVPTVWYPIYNRRCTIHNTSVP